MKPLLLTPRLERLLDALWVLFKSLALVWIVVTLLAVFAINPELVFLLPVWVLVLWVLMGILSALVIVVDVMLPEGRS